MGMNQDVRIDSNQSNPSIRSQSATRLSTSTPGAGQPFLISGTNDEDDPLRRLPLT